MPSTITGEDNDPIKSLEIQTHRQHNKCLRPNKINVSAEEVRQMVRCSRRSLKQGEDYDEEEEMPPKESDALYAENRLK